MHRINKHLRRSDLPGIILVSVVAAMAAVTWFSTAIAAHYR